MQNGKIIKKTFYRSNMAQNRSQMDTVFKNVPHNHYTDWKKNYMQLSDLHGCSIKIWFSFLFYFRIFLYVLLIEFIFLLFRIIFIFFNFSFSSSRLCSKLLKQGYPVERLKSSFRKFYGRYGDLIEQYEVTLSRMLNDILTLDQQWLPNRSDFPPISWPLYRAWPSPNYEFPWSICNGCC